MNQPESDSKTLAELQELAQEEANEIENKRPGSSQIDLFSKLYISTLNSLNYATPIVLWTRQDDPQADVYIELEKNIGYHPATEIFISGYFAFLLFLIENRKSNQYEWDRKNELALHEGSTMRPNLLIYESMVNFEQDIIKEVLDDIFKPENEEQFKNYIKLDNSELNYRFKNLYKMLKTVVVLGDRLHVLSYARSLAVERFKENFEVNEVINAISMVGDLIVNRLKKQENLKDIHLRIHDEILITVQLIIDELEDSYERLSGLA